MIKKLVDIFLGTVEVRSDTSELIDCLIREKIGYEVLSDGKIVLRLRDARKIEKSLGRDKLTYGKERGIPRYFRKYSMRGGVYIGAAIFTFLVVISQRIVWKIDVNGCEKTDPELIEQNLAELGFTYGTDFKDLDFDKLHNDYLRFHDDLAWISVNMNGTYADVEVKELSVPNGKDSEGIMNVVASESGTITSIEPHEGKPMIKIGDKVAKGDLLLSGIITTGEDGVRYEPSDGVVFAEVSRDFTIEIPKIESTKVYTGEEFCEKRLIFFKKSIKLSGKYRISPYDYDKINYKERLYLFDIVPLPVFVDKAVYREYDTEDREVASEEADKRIDDLYAERLSECLDDARLIAVRSYRADTDDSYVLRCEVTCEANIAIRKKIISQ